jgi:riboflavin kinase/FMN adenylyltransferase
VRFTEEFSRVSARDFCDTLVDSLAMRTLIVGPGFALGHRRAGDVAFLRAYAETHRFHVVEVKPSTRHGGAVSSSRIRAALREGRIAEANAMLGWHYRLAGSVVRGEQLGTELGFPTANVELGQSFCVPADGVYASWLHARGRWLPAATSIGMRPTFNGKQRVIEAHVIEDLDGDLLGEQVRVAFLRRLRGQRRFRSRESLKIAMAQDVRRVRAMLQQARPPE